ncbi:hypothetical protein SAMCCGM7_Ch1324 [Sinorhizobium americanum CCGM7]|nr:hypothetical protein SAMCCGM7_Ch1324 [Sinorhizobium americanum CCGM7]
MQSWDDLFQMGQMADSANLVYGKFKTRLVPARRDVRKR